MLTSSSNLVAHGRELLDVWVEKGRWSAEEVADIRDFGARVEAELLRGSPVLGRTVGFVGAAAGWEPWDLTED